MCHFYGWDLLHVWLLGYKCELSVIRKYKENLTYLLYPGPVWLGSDPWGIIYNHFHMFS